MLEFFRGLFSGNYMPHGMCYLWDPGVLWLHVVSDSLIALSYYAIPLLLFSFIRRRRDLNFQWIFFAFAMFIFACGTTHLLAVWTVWQPVYRFEGLVKAVTAAASLSTAVLLVPLIPTLVALPSPSRLAAVNADLEREVSTRKAAEEALNRVNAELERRVADRTVELATTLERYRFLADAMPQIVWTARPDGTRDYFNRRTSVYTGLPDPVRDWKSAYHPDDLAAMLHSWDESVRTGAEYETEVRIRSAKGDYRWHLSRAVPMHAVDNEITHWVGTSTDIDDRKRLEEQLLQSQKMEAIGRLAGGVAHDFNNMLTVISGFDEMLLDSLEDRPELKDYAVEVRNAAERAGELTRQLLAFSRKQFTNPAVINLNDVVVHTEKMLRRLIGEDIELAVSLAPDLGSVKADAGQIEQILMNLAVNARDAMPSGGKLTIETADIRLDQRYSDRHIDMEPGNYVQLAVTDTGIGMDSETRRHLFEPFFTTKPKGSGTGLGLSIVYGIVKQSGGHILVYTEPGKGASFKIYLPRTRAADPPAASRPEAVKAAAAETILVVEDEPGLLKLVTTMLQHYGYRVLSALSVEQAVRLTKENAGRIDLLLSDVVMPHTNGPDLARQLREIQSDLKVVFMSGYAETGMFRHGLLESGADFIQKPFSAVALTNKIREVLRP
jgi:PAS domain S-box-containing protein